MVFGGGHVAGLYKSLGSRVVNFVKWVSVGGFFFILDRYCLINVSRSPFQVSSSNVKMSLAETLHTFFNAVPMVHSSYKFMPSSKTGEYSVLHRPFR